MKDASLHCGIDTINFCVICKGEPFEAFSRRPFAAQKNLLRISRPIHTRRAFVSFAEATSSHLRHEI